MDKKVKEIAVSFYIHFKNLNTLNDVGSEFDIWYSKLLMKENPDPSVIREMVDVKTSFIGEKESSHYRWFYKGLLIDPYRIFELYKISSAPQQHAIKKLLRAGKSVKSLKQDIQEVTITLERWLDMIEEDKLVDKNDIPC